MARRSIPSSVMIGGIKFRIVIKKMENWGMMHFDDREIWISEETAAKKEILVDTLRHEMLHATLSIAGHSWAKKIEEEPIVRAIEHIFLPAVDALMAKLNKL
jgi:hypothetical protein